MSSSSTLLFGRKAQLIVTPNNTNTGTASNASTATGTVNSPFTFSKATPLPGISISMPGVGPNVNGNQDVSLHFKFDINASDVATPNTAVFRVYNLGQHTIGTILNEYTGVALQAGYESGDNYGTIFQGNITQFRKGKENNVDSFLEIEAADGDVEYNFGFSSFPIPAGTTYAVALQQYANSLGLQVDPQVNVLMQGIGGVSLRGAVAFGPTKTFLYRLAQQVACRWSIQNGKIILIPLDGYLPGEAVVINSTSGMVGIPETTDQGVKVRCLINPKIQIGQLIQINEQDITTDIETKQYYKNVTNQGAFVAPVGRGTPVYRVQVINYTGDTRETPWYMDIIAVLVDQSAPNVVNPNFSILGTLGKVPPYPGTDPVKK